MRIDSDSEGDSDSPPLKKARFLGPAIKREYDDEAAHTPSCAASNSEGSASTSPSPEPEPEPKPWELKYYPGTYSAVEKFKKIVGPAPPDTDDLDEAVEGLAIITRPKYMPSIDPKPKSKIVTLRLPPGTINKNASYTPNGVGFMDLPGELRNQVYVLAFKSKQQIDFKNRKGFSRSAALLRVNRVIYNEARNILYGENRFIFDQDTHKIGPYYEQEWTEINYANIRKFLTDIGPENIGFIKNIGLNLEDATPSGHPNKDINERRFEKNKDLYWILKHLARYGKIEKLKLGFCGRRTFHLSKNEATFLHALTAVKTDELKIGHPSADFEDNCRWHRLHFGKLTQSLESMLESVMVRPVPLNDMDPRLEF